jgi:eukaryotic-like serine/threonine-protein kinase
LNRDDEQRFAGRTFGPYTVTGVLGRGGMGIVLRARHTELGREVALKVMLNAQIAQDEVARARFLREAQLMARLRHPGLLHIFDVAIHEALPYFAMNLVDGLSLDQSLTSRDPEALAELLAKVCDALG